MNEKSAVLTVTAIILIFCLAASYIVFTDIPQTQVIQVVEEIENPVVREQKTEITAEVQEDLSANSLDEITFNPKWRECFTLSHENNGIIPGLLHDIPVDGSRELQQKLIQQNKVAMLFAAGVDPWVCWYYASNFEIQDTPSYVEMQEDIKLHEETWEKLRFFLDHCIFEPTLLNGEHWNDGVRINNNSYQLVSRRTTYKNISATIILVGDQKPSAPEKPVAPQKPPVILKNNCGNIQREEEPKVPKLPPTTEKQPKNSTPKSTLNHPQNPATDPVQENNPELVKPTEGYKRGDTEEQAGSERLNAGQLGPDGGGVSNPTDNPKAGVETQPPPPPAAP